jgi:formate hydrogenlyase subunit 4
MFRQLPKFIDDVLKDSNSKKFSLTRILAIILFFMVLYIHFIAIDIMIEKQEIDHLLLIEDFTFIGSAIISKNYFNRNIPQKQTQNNKENEVLE